MISASNVQTQPTDITRIFTPNRVIFTLIVVGVAIFYAVLPVTYPPESSIIDDSLEYAAQAESDTPINWFHPHHLLNNATHRLVWMILGGESSPWRIIHLMRWTSHLSMGLALAFFYLIALRMGNSRSRALALVIFLTPGCSFWVFGSVAEVVAPSLALFLAVVYGLFYNREHKPPSPKAVFLLGILYGLAVTWNQIDIVYMPALWLGIMGFEKGKRIKILAIFTLAAGAWIILSYATVILFVRGTTDWEEIYNYITRYSHWGIWGKGNITSLPISIRFLMLTQSFSLLRPELIFNGFFAIIASVATVIAFLVGIWGWFAPEITKRDPRLSWVWMAAVSLIALGFVTWWQADGWDFWVMPWTLIILGWARFTRLNRYAAIFTLLAFTIIIGLFNLIRLELPRREEAANPYYSVLITIKDEQKSDCYMLITVNPHLWRYAYYWGRIEHADFFLADMSGRFSNGAKKELVATVTDYFESAEHKPLLVDEHILGELEEAFAENVALSDWVRNRSTFIAQASFEGVNVKIYEITKPASEETLSPLKRYRRLLRNYLAKYFA